jgi:hypothetical protein
MIKLLSRSWPDLFRCMIALQAFALATWVLLGTSAREPADVTIFESRVRSVSGVCSLTVTLAAVFASPMCTES